MDDQQTRTDLGVLSGGGLPSGSEQMCHHLGAKWWLFTRINGGSQCFDIRIDDRAYAVGDLVKYSLTHCAPYQDPFERQILGAIRLREYLEIPGLRWRIARALMPDVVILSLGLVGADYGMEGKA